MKTYNIIKNENINYNIFRNQTINMDNNKQDRILHWNNVKDNYSWHSGVNYRLNPYLYKIGKGEQGVLTCEPYKSEILPFWKFATPELAEQSSNNIYAMFLKYLENNDFIGADMSRKFLMMGFTRSRRYANHKSGRKYSSVDGTQLPLDIDEEKAKSADIFKEKWLLANRNQQYIEMKSAWPSK